ncbi:MAG: LytTR family DNA-binding domain-containing protein [Eubacteriales bacterium]|nr:LytTR family DNA-binding domain-containing protein [Eubacteriales bacterium]
METIRIAICDDTAEDAHELSELIRNTRPDLDKIDTYTDAGSLLDRIEHGLLYELIFLDVYMDKMDGPEAAHLIQRLLPEAEIVFVTVSREHAVRAFELNALHYLVKPVMPVQMNEIFSRFERNKKETSCLEIRVGKEIFTLKTDRVHYIQSQNSGTDIYMDSGVLHSSERTSIMGTQVSASFLNIRRGLYVNMNYIQQMDTDSCLLKNGERVLLSRKDKAKIRSRYKEYIYGIVKKEGD